MIHLDTFLTAVVLVIAFYVVFFIGKLIHSLLHREYNLIEELVQKDNPALALAVMGYYAGLVICIGGAMIGPSRGIAEDILDLVIYGTLGIVLLNISWIVCDKFILYQFKINDELIRDQNQGTGAVSMGVSIASGFIIFGAVSGEGGTIWTAIVFWAIGQAMLILAGLVYKTIVPYSLHDEIEKDNVAAGVSFAGALIGMGIIVGLTAEGDFSTWAEELPAYLISSIAGLIILPLIRLLTDKILLPTVKLTDEIANQETPNIGAAYIEAFAYIAGAFIISWCI